MSEKKIEVGDAVKLKSGGVPMTVTDVYENDEGEVEAVELMWHDVHGRPRTAENIPVDCLVAST